MITDEQAFSLPHRSPNISYSSHPHTSTTKHQHITDIDSIHSGNNPYASSLYYHSNVAHSTASNISRIEEESHLELIRIR